MSFADPDRPEGQQWLGCIHVLADDFMEAVEKTHRMGINPGGEVASVDVDSDEFLQKFPHVPLNRLIKSREELEALVGKTVRMFDDDGNLARPS
jgi:hypothetical protein